MGAIFLGQASIKVPAAGNTEGVHSTLVLEKRDKHESVTQRLAAAAGLAPHALGTLAVHVYRAPRDPNQDTPRQGLLSGLRSRVGRKSTGAPGTRRLPTLMHGATPDPFSYLHVDIVRARRLLPMDRTIGKDPSTWTSDPFVTAQLLPAAAGGEMLQTEIKPTTLFPQWDEELLLQAVPRATSVKLCVYDNDKVGGNDMLGELVLPLPPRPEEAGAQPQPLVQGWYPLVAPAAERESLVAALRAVGRNDDAMALAGERHGRGGSTEGLLGELYVRLSWGHGGKAADVNHRPALRPRLATLRVRVHEARGLLPRFADRPVVTVKCESAVGITPAAIGTRDPVYPADLSDFTFAVTELTGDVVFTVLDRDPVMGDQVAGEVCLPLQLLLAPSMAALPAVLAGPRMAGLLPASLRGGVAVAPPQAQRPATLVEAPSDSDLFSDDDAASPGQSTQKEADWTVGLTPKWAEIIPPRLPGEAMQRVRPRPEKPLGALCFTVQLTMETDGFFAYMAPDVMPLEAPPGKDASQDFSFAALNVSLGRMLDGIFMPMFAPLRTLLYIQSWQSPRMNGALIGAWVFFTLFAWNVFFMLTPLWIMLWPVFHGYVSYLIHKDDYVPLFSEDEAEEIKARGADAAAKNQRDLMLWEAKGRALAAIRAANDPAIAAAAAAAGVGTLSAVGNSVASMFGMSSGENESAAALSMYKRIKGKLETAHVYGIYYAEIFEHWSNIFTWRDKTLSAVVAVAFAVIGLAGSLVVAAACMIGSTLGLGMNHVALVAGLACFKPSPEGLRSFLETTDYYLSYIPITLTSQCGGTGLLCTVPAERRVPLSDAALRERIEAEATAAAELAYKAEEAERQARGTVRPVKLDMEELLSFAWLYRLVARAPITPRDTHVSMAAHVIAATRPNRNWGEAVNGTPQRTKSGPSAANTPTATPRTSAMPPPSPTPSARRAEQLLAQSSAQVQMEDTPPRSSMGSAVSDTPGDSAEKMPAQDDDDNFVLDETEK